MIHRNNTWIWVGLALCMACEKTESSGAGAAPERTAAAESAHRAMLPSPDGPLVLVADRRLVCMVNDQFMGRPQFPIVVDGNTYYGCCPACKERLNNDPRTGTATRPGHPPADRQGARHHRSGRKRHHPLLREPGNAHRVFARLNGAMNTLSLSSTVLLRSHPPARLLLG